MFLQCIQKYIIIIVWVIAKYVNDYYHKIFFGNHLKDEVTYS